MGSIEPPFSDQVQLHADALAKRLPLQKQEPAKDAANRTEWEAQFQEATEAVRRTRDALAELIARHFLSLHDMNSERIEDMRRKLRVELGRHAEVIGGPQGVKIYFQRLWDHFDTVVSRVLRALMDPTTKRTAAELPSVTSLLLTARRNVERTIAPAMEE